MVVRLAALALALAAGACSFNQSGNLSADDRGDTSRPARRGSPVAALRAACGDGDPVAPGLIARQPYVQRVTATAATVGWVTTAPGAQRVEVTRPDGSRVATAPAATEVERAGRRQQWATVANLEPDTTYCYAIAGDAPVTARTGFRTAPRPDQPVRFLAFGDSGGGGTDQQRLRDRMFDFPSQLVIHTGDIAYDEGTLRQFDANVFGVYHELFRNLPVFPIAGNHDYKTAGGAPFREVFALPGDGREQSYAFDWGMVHFAALDTEADYAAQARWLDADLAATAQPWKIVYLHRPPYSSGSHGSDRELRAAVAPVLEKHGVQLVLSGHDHDYERTTPQGGVHYVVTGGGGRGTYEVGHSAFTAFAEEVIHFVYVEVDRDELVLHAIDATGAEFDSVAIPRA